MKLTHPVTKTQIEVSDETVYFSGSLSLDIFILRMLGEDRVDEKVAHRVIEDEGWVLLGHTFGSLFI